MYEMMSLRTFMHIASRVLLPDLMPKCKSVNTSTLPSICSIRISYSNREAAHLQDMLLLLMRCSSCRCAHHIIGICAWQECCSFFGSSQIKHSVVRSKPATDAAFCTSLMTTSVGSMTPSSTMSTYFLVSTLKP